jgi:hypothetical protein
VGRARGRRRAELRRDVEENPQALFPRSAHIEQRLLRKEITDASLNGSGLRPHAQKLADMACPRPERSKAARERDAAKNGTERPYPLQNEECQCLAPLLLRHETVHHFAPRPIIYLNNMKRPLLDSRHPLEKYSFLEEEVRPIRLQLLDELNAKRRKFTRHDESRSYEIDLYIDSLEIAKAPDSHDRIMAFCTYFDLPKNFAHVMDEKIKSGSKSLIMGNSTLEMMTSTLINFQQITEIEITIAEAYLYDGSKLLAAFVAALEETSHLTSLKILFDGEYDDAAINKVIGALGGHHGLENLEFRLCDRTSMSNLPSFSALLRNKDRLSSLSLQYLRGTTADAIAFAQVLAGLPALEHLNLECFNGDEWCPIIEEWSKLQDSSRPAIFSKLQSLLIDEEWSFGEDLILRDKIISFITNLPSLRYLNIDLVCFGEEALGKLISCAEQKKILVWLGESPQREQIEHPSLQSNRKIQLLMAEIFLRKAMDSILHAIFPDDIRKSIIQECLGQGTPSDFDDLRSVGSINKAIRQTFVSSRAHWLNYRMRLIDGHLRENPRTDERWIWPRVQTEHHLADLKVLSEFAQSNPGALPKADRERLPNATSWQKL